MLHLKETTRDLARRKKYFVGRCWTTVVILWTTIGILVASVLSILHHAHHTSAHMVVIITLIVAISLVCLMVTWLVEDF